MKMTHGLKMYGEVKSEAEERRCAIKVPMIKREDTCISYKKPTPGEEKKTGVGRSSCCLEEG